MAKQTRTAEDVLRRVQNFLDVRHGKITGISFHFELLRGKFDSVWQDESEGDIHVQLADVRTATISQDSHLSSGERREIEVLLYRFLMED